MFQRHGLKVTFLMNGKKVEQFPDEVSVPETEPVAAMGVPGLRSSPSGRLSASGYGPDEASVRRRSRSSGRGNPSARRRFSFW